MPRYRMTVEFETAEKIPCQVDCAVGAGGGFLDALFGIVAGDIAGVTRLVLADRDQHAPAMAAALEACTEVPAAVLEGFVS